MKIEIASLRLVGCGPFDDVTLDFCDKDGKPKKTILLAGANGSGKTTVLEIIANRAFSAPKKEILSVYSRLDFHFDSELWTMAFGKRPGDDPPYNVAGAGKATEAILHQIGSDLTHTPRSVCPPRILYLPHPRFLLPVEAEFLHPEEFVYSPNYRLESSNQFPGSLSSYLIWLEYSDIDEYNETIKYMENLQISQKKFSIIRKKLQSVVTTPEGIVHPIDKLSSGEQNLFIILLELRRQLTHGSIILIDEVEGSLHPAYQYKLIYALQKLQEEFDFQLITTTHSTDILDAVGPGNTLFLTDYSDLKVELMK